MSLQKEHFKAYKICISTGKMLGNSNTLCAVFASSVCQKSRTLSWKY